jgi:hypothetical protein
MSSRCVLGFVLAGALGVVAACGALPTGKVPVDNPLNEFEPPDESELTGASADGWGEDDWDADDGAAGKAQPEAAVDPDDAAE